MDRTTALERLAELAHELWRGDLEHRGWSHGTHYDAQGRVHDALVPFPSLDPRDRRQAILGVTALGILPTLVESIWYERGPARLLDAAEMHAGMLVGCNTEECTLDPDAPPPPEPGRVVSWDVDTKGMLSSVTVVWADGSKSEHIPEARELRRLGEHPGPSGPEVRA